MPESLTTLLTPSMLLQEFLQNLFVPGVAVTIALALTYGLARRFFAIRKIQDQPFPKRRFMRHEVPWALATLAAGGLVGISMQFFIQEGSIKTGAISPLRIIAEFIAYFFAFDCYFYWVHRLLHTDALWNFMHKVHHESDVPTPLTAFSFNPIEGLVMGMFMPLFSAAIGAHAISVAAMGLYGMLNSVAIHSGFEFFPKFWARSKLTRWYLTPLWHDQHHEHYRCNYGGFTTLWDRAFGTVYPHFEERWDELMARRGAQSTPAPPSSNDRDAPRAA